MHLDRFWKYCMIRKIAFQGPTFVGPFFRTSPPAERRITMLKKKESIDGLVNRVVETKLAAALKGKVTLENKTVSMEEFNKMFE